MDFIGDIHGQLDKLAVLLCTNGLMDSQGKWTGGTRTLWFLGDFTDRGPDGIGVIRLIMRLQCKAREAGGQVRALLGNHDVLFLAASYFGNRKCNAPAGTFLKDWQENGGQMRDMALLTSKEIDWLSQLPAMAHAGDDLLAHADGSFYQKYGDSVDAVNQSLTSILHSEDPEIWDQLLEDFCERLTFWKDPACIKGFLGKYGGLRLIHGHTPIPYMDLGAGEAQPLIYGDGRCVNVDGGLFMGGKGFIYSKEENL
ncbi:MAG TPA: metallophosphoesterase family protein [Bacillales bacterium]|nr:metallophosphoesterase family protein [Bacillales bacterium]